MLRPLLGSGVDAWPLVRASMQDDAMRGALAAALPRLSVDELLAQVPAGDRDAWAKGLRECLQVLLRDPTRIGTTTMRACGDRIDYHDATRADLAATILHSLWPDEFPFQAATSRRSRARQIAWLCARLEGANATPPPDVMPLDRVAVQQLRDLVAGRAAPDTIQRLEEFGLRALPAIQHVLRDQPDSVAERTALEALASRLANHVAAVEFDASATPLSTSARESLRALNHQQLDAESLLRTLLLLTQDEGAAGKRVVLHFERYGADDGASLRCELASPTQAGPQLKVVVTAGSLRLANEHRFTNHRLDTLEALHRHDDVLVDLAKALAAKSTTPVEITIGLVPK